MEEHCARGLRAGSAGEDVARVASGRGDVLCPLGRAWRVLRSVRAVPPQHDFDGLEENPQIHQQRLLADIVRVDHDPAPVIGVISAGDLPEAGDSRLRGHVGRQIAPIAEHFFLHDGPRTHQAHLATQHVPDLR